MLGLLAAVVPTMGDETTNPLIGLALFASIVIVGLLKAISAAGQPETNKRCAKSMIWLLLSTLLLMAGVAGKQLDLIPDAMFALVSLAFLLGVLVSLFLSVTGLFQRRRTDPP